MKIINVLRSWNLRDQFQYRWAVGRRQTIIKTNAEAILTAKGIEVVDIKDIIRPAFEEEPYTPLPDEEVVIPEEKPLCYVMKNSFNPLAGLPQSQLITKTIVFDSYPDAISKKIEDCTAEEENLCKKIVLKANLLDAEQKKLPKMLDPINLPGYKPSRHYSITESKKIHSTIQHMFFTLNMKNSKENMNTFHLMPSKISFHHPDGIVQMDHNCNFMTGSKEPLEPIVGNDEVASYDDSALPNLYPLSSLIHTNTTNDYELKDKYALSRVHLKPHTIFVGHNPMDLRLRRISPRTSLCQKLSLCIFFCSFLRQKQRQGCDWEI
ncbi:hypothetical protein Avbf_04858 [Armadillidium vulgare]|nr:hypothetical protein Avbf_04858 [Armadillidium vulgare]